MTPAIAEALADLVMSIHPGGVPVRKGDALCVALGLDADAPWDDVATALRALARPDVGLPAGWSVGEPAPCIYFTIYTANGPDSAWATLTHCRDGEAFWQFRGTTPLAVYAHLLRAAGVSNG